MFRRYLAGLLIGLGQVSLVFGQTTTTPPTSPDAELKKLRDRLDGSEKKLDEALKKINKDISDLKPVSEAMKKLAEAETTLKSKKKEIDAATAKLEELKKSVSAQEAHKKVQEDRDRISKVEESQTRLYWVGGIVAAVISFLGVGSLVFAYKSLQNWGKKSLLKSLHDELKDDIKQAEKDLQTKIDGRLTSEHDRINRQMSDLVVLVHRAERGRHDDAIEAIGWTGTLDSLREYPVEIQKLIVRSASLAQFVPQTRKGVAWKAAIDIFEKDRTEANLSFLYVLAVDARRWAEGYELYQAQHRTVPIKTDAAGYHALLRLLRRRLKFAEATEAMTQYRGRMTTEITHILGHVKNNMGEFKQADDLLRPQVEVVLKGGTDRPEDWPRVVYSFIKNCTEWGKPDAALDSARFAVRMIGDTLLQLGVVRLALLLEALGKDNEATELITGIKRNLALLPEDGTTWQIHARLMARDSTKVDEAISSLKEREPIVRSGAAATMDPQRAEYFFTCLIAELEIRAERYDEARHRLQTLTMDDEVGEAFFLMALSYAKELHHAECANYLEYAGQRHRRWCKIAQLRELYPEIETSHEAIGRALCQSLDKTGPAKASPEETAPGNEATQTAPANANPSTQPSPESPTQPSSDSDGAKSEGDDRQG